MNANTNRPVGSAQLPPSVEEKARPLDSLTKAWLAIGATPASGRAFAGQAFLFAAVGWGVAAGGAFFRTPLIVFTALCAAALICQPGAWERLLREAWLRNSALAAAAAVLLSATIRGQLSAAPFALASIGSAAALGAVVLASPGAIERRIHRRFVIDVAVAAAALGTIGVALHINHLAELQAEGWRADAGIGYANVLGLVLLLGLLCAAVEATRSHGTADLLRCYLLLVGICATQSRSSVLALAVAALGLAIFGRRSVAVVLCRTAACALTTFVGLIPAVSGDGNRLLGAVAGVAVGLALMKATSAVPRRPMGDAVLFLTACGSAAVIWIRLSHRIADAGSDEGRVRIWHEALSRLHVTGVIGAGPGQLAEFSRGHLGQLFDHDDVLQYVEYYGAFGAVAIVLIIFGVARGTAKARRTAGSDPGLASVAVLSVAAVCLVDFPLQVPVVPAVAAVIVASAIGAGDEPRPVVMSARDQVSVPATAPERIHRV